MNARSAVGIIGVGAIGHAIAQRLLAGGRNVVGFRRNDLGGFVELGGIWAPNAASVADSASTIVLTLPTDAALVAVMAEIAPRLRDHVVLCLGTHTVAVKEAAASAALRAGAVFLDGEISGTPAMLIAGNATVMICGDVGTGQKAQAAEVLKQFAGGTVWLATFGDASRMKLITNFLVGVHTVAAAEALVMASKLGLDLQSAVDAIGCSAGASTMLAVRGPMMAQRKFASGKIESFLRFYDLLRNTLAEQGTSTGPLFALSELLYRQAIIDGRGGHDISVVIETLQGRMLDVSGASEGHLGK